METLVFLCAFVLPLMNKMYTGSNFRYFLILMSIQSISVKKINTFELFMPYLGLALFLCNIFYYIYNYFH